MSSKLGAFILAAAIATSGAADGNESRLENERQPSTATSQMEPNKRQMAEAMAFAMPESSTDADLFFGISHPLT